MDDDGNLEALSLGVPIASALLCVGVDCDRVAVVDDFLELGAMMLDHEKYMRHAIELAGNVPKLPFAAVIVDQDTGQILSQGWNQSSINPTWHGEIDAINRMVQSGYDFSGRPLVLYTTAEPCPMCQGAIQWTGIQTVVFGASIRFLQQLGWKQIDILAQEVADRTPFNQCTVLGGVLQHECQALFESVSK